MKPPAIADDSVNPVSATNSVAALDAVDPMMVGLSDDVLSGWYNQESNELFSGFRIDASDTVLDVGCGSGGAPHFCGMRGAHVICVDIDADKVAAARRTLEKTAARRIETIVSDASPLPLHAAIASKIICMEVLEHVDNPAQFLAELVRVGKPGAQYLLTVPDPVQEQLQKQLAPASYFEKPNHIRIIQRAEFEVLIIAAGLEIEQQARHGFYSALMWALFWACDQRFTPPWHRLLKSWGRTWGILLAQPDGERVKRALDNFVPKCQVIVARKPHDLPTSVAPPVFNAASPVVPPMQPPQRAPLWAKLTRSFHTLAVRGASALRIGRASATIDEGDNYTELDTRLSGWFDERTGELLSGFAIRAEDTVLDIGCGDAPFIQFCARQGAEVIFADIDAEKVASVGRALQGSNARAMHPLVTDANPLQLADNSVSKIVAMEVLEHVDDPAQFMRELVRVGRPGAQYLITVPDALSEEVQRELAHESYFLKPNHIRVFQREAFERLIVDAGLVVERRVHYGFFWSIWWCFFWVCKQDLGAPWHPLLESWGKTWQILLKQPEGPRLKAVLDNFMPKSQAIIARKPL